MLDTPVLLLIFNRPKTTKLVFEQIRLAKPKKLFIAADGPRENKIGEQEKCEQARAIVNDIDWDCEINTLFRDKNLGCGCAVSSAISWFFENVEEGIILEDDCLPNQDFFRFCNEMLIKFRFDKEIMEVTGTSLFSNQQTFGNATYYFSEYGSIWGWATWKRAWSFYDIKMSDYPQKISSLKNRIEKKKDGKVWLGSFEKAYLGQFDTWDYQWIYTIWKNKGLCVVPNYNLISNIGFGSDSTHTGWDDSVLAKIKHQNLPNIIIHDESKKVNKIADGFTEKIFTQHKKPIIFRIFSKLKKVILSRFSQFITNSYHKLRVYKYKLFSDNTYVKGNPSIIQPLLIKGQGEVEFGKNVYLGTADSIGFYGGYIYLNPRNKSAKIIFEDDVWTNNNLNIIALAAGVTIKKDTIIGSNVEIYDSDFHEIDPTKRKSGNPKSQQVIIGENVWIGSNVKILKGVEIGTNSIIANNSVVANNIPANVIAGGVPARFIKNIN